MAWTFLLVETEPIFRMGLHALLDPESDFRVIGETGDATRACELAATLQPQVITLDVALGGQSGLTVAREIRRTAPASKILVLTSHLSEQYVVEALSAGVRGYVGKDQPPAEVLRALRIVAQGQTYLAPTISHYVLDQYVRMNRAGSSGPLLILTPRERDVFELTVRGTPAREIAARLAISQRTVDTHRTRVLRKLELHSTADMVRFAARLGLLDDPLTHEQKPGA